jgi:hypothetical protein
MEGIVSNQTQQQVRRSEGERAESNGDREEDRFLRRSLISSHLRLFLKASEMSSSGLSLLRLFRISSRVGRRAKTTNCHLGVTLTPEIIANE